MFKATLKGEIDQASISKASCILPISLGQKYHENDKLLSTIELINANFGECTIIIADTLGRHTHLKEHEKETDEEIKLRLIKEGDEWQSRNKDTLAKLRIPHHIYRWDDYLQNAQYQQQRQLVESLYETNLTFSKAVNGSIEKYIRRQKVKMATADVDKAFKDSLEYVKEECAVLLLWDKIARYDYLIYPNKLHEAMYNLRRQYIANENKDPTRMQPLVVEFKKVKQSLEITNGNGNGNDNGHGYVPNVMAGQQHQLSPQAFFQAKPPVGISMTQKQLNRFVKKQMDVILSTVTTLDPQSQQQLLTTSLAHLSLLTSSIIPTKDPDESDSDTSSDSAGSDQEKSPTLSAELNEPEDQPEDLSL